MDCNKQVLVLINIIRLEIVADRLASPQSQPLQHCFMNKTISCLGLPAFLCLAFSFYISGCKKDDAELGTKATAAFTATAISGRTNTYLLQSTSQNAFAYQWDKGNGTFVKGSAVDTAYFPLKGSYTIKLRAFGRGGYDSTAQSVTIAVDDILNNATFKLLIAKSWKLNIPWLTRSL